MACARDFAAVSFDEGKSLSVQYETDSNVLGSGTFGIVVSARRRSDGMALAIKMPNELDHRSVKCMQQELACHRDLQHEAIIKLVDAGTMLGLRPCLVLERASFSLDKVNYASTYNTQRALKVCTRWLLSGLRYMHERNWVHMDLKPHNILLLHGRVWKIADFGCAQRPGVINHKHVGNILYTPPEYLLQPSLPVSGRYDMWSVGLLLAQIITAKDLLPPDSPNWTKEMAVVATLNGLMNLIGGIVEETECTPDTHPLCAHPNLEHPPVQASPVRLIEHLTGMNPSLNSNIGLEEEGVDFFCELLTNRHSTRLSAEEALSHPFLN